MHRITTHKVLFQKALMKTLEAQFSSAFRDGDRKFIGYLGEQAFLEKFPLAQYHDTFDYDFLLEGKRIDVKTRITKVEPRENFDFVVPCFKKDQQCDFFVFCFVWTHFEYIDLWGYLSFEDFHSKAEPIETGINRPQGGQYASGGKRIFLRDINEFGGNK